MCFRFLVEVVFWCVGGVGECDVEYDGVCIYCECFDDVVGCVDVVVGDYVYVVFIGFVEVVVVCGGDIGDCGCYWCMDVECCLCC